jgi:hypothetical protein
MDWITILPRYLPDEECDALSEVFEYAMPTGRQRHSNALARHRRLFAAALTDILTTRTYTISCTPLRPEMPNEVTTGARCWPITRQSCVTSRILNKHMDALFFKYGSDWLRIAHWPLALGSVDYASFSRAVLSKDKLSGEYQSVVMVGLIDDSIVLMTVLLPCELVDCSPFRTCKLRSDWSEFIVP